MNDTHRRLARPLPILLGLALLLLAGGCFNPFDPRISQVRSVRPPAPAPSSPQKVIELFAWCWNNRAIDEYREIFTDDYRFVFQAADSAGNAYRDRPFLREDELISSTNLFVGGGGSAEPPASSIHLELDRNLIALPDGREGKNGRWHRQISTNVTLEVVTGDAGSGYQVTGRALFFVVRGDSALIPQELKSKGFRPDSTRWWIERWEDQTVQGPGGASARPAPQGSQTFPLTVTWGGLKRFYGDAP